MKPVVIFLLALLVAGALWFRSSASSGTTTALTLDREDDAALVLDSADLPDSGFVVEPEVTSVETERSEVEFAATTEVASRPDAAVPTSKVPCAVILTDSSGIEHGGLSGTIKVTRWKGNTGRSEEFTVVDGSFEMDTLDADRLTVGQVELDGRGAILVDRGKAFPVDQGPIVIYVTWPRSLRLTVLSAASGEHLSNITVVRSRSWPDDSMKHPGKVTKGRTMLTGGFSPVELQPTTQDAGNKQLSCFVHSPGCAWTVVHLDMSNAGDREVRLSPGGDLAIHLIGVAPTRKARLCLLPTGKQDEPRLAEASLPGTGPAEFLSLAPGSYVASVQIGRWYANPLVLGQVPVEVTAGERSEYELTLETPVETLRTQLAGTVVVPAAWEVDDFDLNVEFDGTPPDGSSGRHSRGRDEMIERAEESDAWAFDFGEVVTGEYLLELRSGGYPAAFEYGIRMTVEVGTAQNVRIELPPPTNVLVRVIDGTSGESAGLSSIHYGPIIASAGFGVSLMTVSPREGDGYFAFRAPLGEIRMGAFGGNYTSLNETVQLQAGDNEFTFKLDRNCPLSILLLDGETPVPFTEDWYPHPEHLDGEGTLLFTGGGSTGFRTALSEPGRYVFELPIISGFEPIPKQTIAVTRGEPTVHKIQLKRLP